MSELMNTLFEWFLIGGRGFLGFFAAVCVIAVVGSVIAFIGYVISRAFFTKKTKEETFVINE